MKNTIILYRSNTGFTERYAGWLSEALHCQKVAYEDRKTVRLADYDTLIYGGGFHAGRISGLKWFLEQTAALKGKNLVVFASGASPAGTPDVETALRNNFTDEQRSAVKVFYFQSGLCYEKMGLMDKLLMAIFRMMLKRSDGEGEAYKMVQHSYDVASKEQLTPLITYCEGL